MTGTVLRPARAQSRKDGAPIGVAPAKVTSCTLKPHKGAVKITVGLPADPHFADYAVFALDDEGLTDPGFPGGSPVLRSASSNCEDDTAIVGLRRHYWIVTRDKYGTPNAPVAANAFYAQSIVPGTSLSLRAGVF